MPWRPSSVQTGERLPKALRPVNRYPPSTRSAFVLESSTGRSLPDSAWPAAKTSPRPAASSIQSQDLSPAPCSVCATPTQYVCMFVPRAVAGAQ